MAQTYQVAQKQVHNAMTSSTDTTRYVIGQCVGAVLRMLAELIDTVAGVGESVNEVRDLLAPQSAVEEAIDD